jgi:hypothetical protein
MKPNVTELCKRDYWYPSSLTLKTIDCVAKLVTGEFLLLQITIAKEHKIDAAYLKRISGLLTPQRYMAVVPNKDICDSFRPRLDSDVPLYVAYVDDACKRKEKRKLPVFTYF